jgi:Carboxypeptidase regulatory-like domain
MLYLLGIGVARADVYAKIRGVVTDPTGAVVPNAKIVATNVATGIETETSSGSDGNYEFLQLAAPATFSLTAEALGFNKLEVTGIQLSLNQIFVKNLSLELGQITSTVTVYEEAVAQVEATSIELGTVINSVSIVNMPLNGRNWVDLQKLAPGVVEASDSLGSYSTNGSQSDQNSYLINGTDNNDLILNTVSVTPSPDAIAEFKMVTNTINPEYGRNSGAILNATIKSGTNQFHGTGFEFFRDTSLNAKNFFAPAPAIYHQNQFGGVIGGPIRKDRTFFFFSYAGTRQTRPETSGDCGCFSPGSTPVFTQDERNGVFPDLATSGGVSAFSLVGNDGNTYPAGTPYSTIFSDGLIPSTDLNPVSVNLLKFVPLPTVGNNYQFNPAFAGTDDQLLTRIDHTLTSKDTVWAYVLWQRLLNTQTLPFGGASLPGFGETDVEHWQQYTAAWNHTFNGTTLNEVRLGYTRFNYVAVTPQTPVAPSTVGFTGITPQIISGQGLPVVNVNGLFDLGFSLYGPQPRIDQTYHFTDSVSKIIGTHSLKIGFDMRRFQVYNPFAVYNDGNFTFNGAGAFSTGNPGADFLLGIPDFYAQGSGDIMNERAQEYYLYVQDQWKVRRNLTVTYGLGWSIDTPMADNYHDNHAGIAFRPGQQSTVFPTSPTGYVFQGDAGVNAFGTTKFKHFGPRLGIAYSPDWGKLTGGAGKTSIRAGFGIYFNRFSGETAGQTLGSPPFAVFSFGVGDIGASPSFADPYTGYDPVFDGSGNIIGATPTSIPNKFPFTPTSTPDFSQFLPLSVSVYDPNITIPYAENFNLTVERQFGDSTVFSLAYVGSVGHKLLLSVEQNPGINPAGCAADPSCAGDAGFQPLDFPGNYKYPGDVFASVGQIQTTGNSNYNALQASVKRQLSRGLQFMAAYTWSKALDNGSGYENSGFGGGGRGGFGQLRSTNPFNQSLDYGPSIYDARHRFVISYVYEIPSVRHFTSLSRLPKRLTDGWQISGITTFQSGFPLDVVDSSLPSLTGSFFNFYSSGWAWDVPDVLSAPKYLNPRTDPNNLWFDPSTFASPTIGTQGNAGRNILRGPGRNNFDFALMKETQITDSTKLEMRIEFFNIFNHTQFDPVGITTDINASNFGQESAAHDPRIIQLAAKFYF